MHLGVSWELVCRKNQLLDVRPIHKVGNAYLELKLLGPQYDL